ncbi:putative G-protein coupled receptor 82 [Gastrophryne carolinensis]
MASPEGSSAPDEIGPRYTLEAMCNNTCLSSSAMSTIVLPIVYTLMFLPSITGNAVSLWIFGKLNRRSSTHIYLMNLAISNIAVTSGIPFQIVYYAHGGNWQYNSIKCSVVLITTNILTHTSMCVSITIFCWIAISRYATLVKYKDGAQNAPMSIYEKIIYGNVLKTFRNPKFAGYLCACVWITFMCPNIFLFLLMEDAEPDTCCSNPETELGHESDKISSVIQSTCFFLFVSTVFLFYYLFLKHIKHLQANSCIGEKHFIHARVKRNIAVIVVLLVVCFAPYHLVKLFLVGLEPSRECQALTALVEIKNTCLCLAEFRSSTDPIVYFCLDDTFKGKIKSIFTKHCEDSAAKRASDTPLPTVTRRIMQTSTTDEN